MRDIEDLLGLYKQRKTDAGPVLAKAAEIRDIYNGDYVLPLPELDTAEKAAVANLVQIGMDQVGMRVASVMPAIDVPPVRLGIKASENKARIRRGAMYGWWEANRVRLKLRRRARWLLGYATAPVMIRPGKEIPRWDLRDPLSTFPAPSLDPDEITPPDCIFGFKRSIEWCRYRYPEQTARLKLARDATHLDLFEYVDHNESVLAVVGQSSDVRDRWGDAPKGTEVEELLRIENRTGMCPAVVPGRITLDRPMGQFDGIVGIYQTQARLMALNVIAVERGIFPEQWLVAPEGRNPEVQTVADGRSGRMGVVRGGSIETTQMNPGVFTNPVIDRLEFNERQTGGIPQEFGGSSSSNIRTGRRGDSVMSAVVDFPVQEAQELFEESLIAENKIAIAVATAYFGPKTVYFSGTKVDYDPPKDFETDEHVVRYAYTGADANNLNIVVGQKIGMGTLSKKTAMGLDPMIRDVETEWDQITVEGLYAAALSSIQTQAADPAGPYQPADLARLMELVASDKKSLFEAVQQLQTEIQERQAAAQAEQPDPAAMQPGLGMPGAPGSPEAGVAIQEPAPSLNNLGNLLGRLRQPQMQVASERTG